MASIHVLRERRDGHRCAVALTVEDGSGQRYRVIRELVREDDQWRMGAGLRESTAGCRASLTRT